MEVPDRELETYAFLRLYRVDFEMARQSCALIEQVRDVQVRHALLRDTIISYCRPFSSNRLPGGRKHSLGHRAVAVSRRKLHDELVKLRHQAFAHTDFDFRSPHVSRWPSDAGNPTYVVGFRNPSYDALLNGINELASLIGDLERYVNQSIERCEARFERLYGNHSSDGSISPTSEQR